MRFQELKILAGIYGRMHLQSSSSAISSWRVHYARGFFDKTRLHLHSQTLLLKEGAENGWSQLDLGAISSLARCIIEAHNAYHYLLEPRLGKDEQELRHNLFLINQSTELERIHSDLGIPPDDFGSFLRQSSIKTALNNLESSPAFHGLTPEQKKRARAGKLPYLTQRYGGPRPLPEKIESGLYKLFSHSVHSFGLGINPLGNGTSTAAAALNVIALSIDASLIYGARIAKKYLASRHRAMPEISYSDRTVIAEFCNPAELELLLEDMGAIRAASNNSFKPKPLRGSA